MRPLRLNLSRHLLLCLLLVVTPSVGRGQAQRSVSRSVLRVALFPYIPDALNDNYRAMVARIEREFESRNPTIDLVLRPLDQNDDFYDSTTLINWLTTDVTSGGYDIVEVDTVLLGELVAAKAISPLASPSGMFDWHPAARRIVTFNENVYGVPHY